MVCQIIFSSLPLTIAFPTLVANSAAVRTAVVYFASESRLYNAMLPEAPISFRLWNHVYPDLSVFPLPIYLHMQVVFPTPLCSDRSGCFFAQARRIVGTVHAPSSLLTAARTTPSNITRKSVSRQSSIRPSTLSKTSRVYKSLVPTSCRGNGPHTLTAPEVLSFQDR